MSRARRERLLAAHRRRLPWADLEDCYSTATLELLAGMRRGRRFRSEEHVANALAQRLASRVTDRRRALQGRSPMAAVLAHGLRLGDAHDGALEAVDVRADVEQLVAQRQELRRLTRVFTSLSRDQRLALASQLFDDDGPARLCRREGWSDSKYRQTAHRARRRLHELARAHDEASQPAASVGLTGRDPL